MIDTIRVNFPVARSSTLAEAIVPAQAWGLVSNWMSGWDPMARVCCWSRS